MSKCEIIFTGHRVHLVLELSLAKAGLKKRIRCSCSDLNTLGILMFPAKLMGGSGGVKKIFTKKAIRQ